MTHRQARVATLLTFAILATSAQAEYARVTGGSVELRYSSFDKEVAGETVDRSSVGGSVELGFNRNFAAQLDLFSHEYGASDLSGTSAALHGIYHLNGLTSLGLFAGQESIEDETVDFYGVEAGFEFARGDAEAYFMMGDYEGYEGNIYGVSGQYEIMRWLSLTAAVDIGDFDGGVVLERRMIGVEADLGNFALTADLGNGDAELDGLASGSEGFLALGARFDFGAERGATFDPRGLGLLVPGL